ncbi:MAG TPA: DUF3305 domain-containing protein [Acetobacteraceae bacterium]|jgi:hypothetical protein
MLMARLPITVLMQRRQLDNRWVQEIWSPVAVLTDLHALAAELPPPATQTRMVKQSGADEAYLVSGLSLELYPDENDGYFENWIAPQPRVFLLWRMQDGRAMPVLASVSYAEGARMLDSGEQACGVTMPVDIHAWLGDYLQRHYEPPAQGRRGHR